MTADTILHRLQKNGRIRPNSPAYYEKSGQAWVPTSWQEYNNQVQQAARALLALGVDTGNIVTILGFNRSEWVIMDLAAMLIGAAAAGIYTTNSPPEVKYILEHSEAPIILVENQSQWDKVNQVRDDLPSLKYIVTMHGTNIEDEMTLDWDTFMAKGNEIAESEIDQRLDSLKPDQLATMIYTSGTTGPPKAVMLSHNNLAWTANASVNVLNLAPSERIVSYLPLSHIAEQMFTIHSAITNGYQVYYAQYPPQNHLNDNLKEIKPTILFGVPRIWERFQAGVQAQLSQATGVRAKLSAWALDVGQQVTELKNQGQEPGGLLGIQYNLANKLVHSKIKAALGLDEVRYGVTGAAPIAKEVLDFFGSFDVTVLEVYGQSEDCGPTSINRPGATKFGTVGQAWPGTDVKIAEDGEILIKGPNVFMGYYKNQAATDETLIDGWLYSGDLGSFDNDGYLSITGRKKEIIITSGGKNIAPKNIEAALKNLDLIAEAVVIGEQRRYLSALLTLEAEAAQKFAEQHGISGSELHTHPTLIAHLDKEIQEQVNSLFARVEHVRKFSILPRNFTVEDGELTPTLKIKRRIINQNFAEQIEAMYE